MKGRAHIMMAAAVVVYAAALAGAVPSLAEVPAAPGHRFTGDLALTLEEAVWQEGQEDQRKPLVLVIECDEGVWKRHISGQSRRHNWGDHWGRLLEATTPGPAMRLRVKMLIAPDLWVGGDGVGEYTLDLRAGGGTPAGPAPGAIEGTWTGTFRGRPCQGSVGGQVLPVRRPEGWMPPGPDEHPRLLMRRSQLPALRQKAKTPWGRAMIERLRAPDGDKSNMAVGQALLYALTGEAAYADKAKELIDREPTHWYTTTGVVHEGPASAVETALAFDLVYDACDEAFRRRMAEWFITFMPFFYSGGDQGQFNQNDVSNWSAMFRSGVGMSALVTLDEPWLALPKPREPEIARLRPPADLAVGQGVPVVRLTPGHSWPEWQAAGPFKVGPVGPAPHPGWTAWPMVLPMRAMPLEDALAPIGGEAAARPESGTRVGDRTFAPLDEKYLSLKDPAARAKEPANAGAIDMGAMAGRDRLTTWYLYSVVENAAAGFFHVEMPVRRIASARVYIAGRPFENGQVLYLEKGRYPVLARVGLSLVGSWMRTEFKLRLLGVSEAEAKARLARETQAYNAQLDAWQAWQEDQAAAGLPPRATGEPGNFWSRHWLAVARQRVAAYAERSIGDIGWNTEGEAYTQHSYRLILAFAHAYRNAMGRDLAPQGHLGRCIAGYLGRTIVGEHLRMQAYGCGGGPLGVDNLARGFGLWDEDLRPAALWLWNRTQAAADAGRLKDPIGPIDRLDPTSAAFMFVNYPLEMKERPPADLRPKVTVDRRKGGYVLRNRWQDDDDFVAQIFANREFAFGTWSTCETGDLRLSGLGADWIVRGAGYGHTGSSRRAPSPRLYSSVLLPSEPITRTPMEAAATFHEAGEDGSGVISLNLDNVYSGGGPGPKGEVKVEPVRPGARSGYDLGIRGLRSFAADYSGRCGAPGLFVVADRVSGTRGRNTWQLVTEKAHQASVAGNVFTVAAANGASLRGTVVSPAGAKIEMAEQSLDHEVNYHGGHRNYSFPRTIITVTGGEFFLVVMTVQRGAAPEVRVEGEGPAAKAAVGGQAVRFDGNRIILGPKP